MCEWCSVCVYGVWYMCLMMWCVCVRSDMCVSVWCGCVYMCVYDGMCMVYRCVCVWHMYMVYVYGVGMI